MEFKILAAGRANTAGRALKCRGSTKAIKIGEANVSKKIRLVCAAPFFDRAGGREFHPPNRDLSSNGSSKATAIAEVRTRIFTEYKATPSFARPLEATGGCMKTNSFTFPTKQTVLTSLLALGAPLLVQAQNEPAIHWINASSQNGATQLNNTGTFITSFQGTNDVTVTQLTGNVSGLVNNSFGGATPGNNPGYITSFLGSPATGTGTGTAGTFGLLGGDGTDGTASFQIDFSVPLTMNSNLMFGDVDTTEEYQVQAYSLVEGTYVQLSLTGWTHSSYSGQTGIMPNANWATWNSSNGTLTAPSGNPQLNSPLDVLTPDQDVDRLVISKLSGVGGGWAFDVVDTVPEPSSTFAIGAGVLGLFWAFRLRRGVGLV